MKSKILLLAVLLLGFAAVFTSCTEEVVEPISTTGGLFIKVQLEGSTGFISGALVGVATSQANLDNGVNLQDLSTDANGQADFGQLNPGNYYYDCSHEIGNDEYYGEGQVQIVVGTDLELTLMLVP
jgi:hypothetical protein